MPESVTTADAASITFRTVAPEAEQVDVWSDLPLAAYAMARVGDGWELTIPWPEVDRLEYLLSVDGAMAPDPGNPLLVDGAFGAHSVLERDSYRAPDWLGREAHEGHRRHGRALRTPVGTVDWDLWTPVEDDRPLPLLICHDGPEMATYGDLLQFVGAQIFAGELPPLRVALLHPGARNERYAANPAYAATLVGKVLPKLRKQAPSDRPPVLMGQSLGALAALHASWTSPGTFGGLFLQSGSFFTPDLDGQESDFEFWPQVTGFVRTVLNATQKAPGAPTSTVVWGTAEENAANNALMAGHLADLGVRTATGTVRDGHTWTAWRDLLDPHLTDLVRGLTG